MHGSTNMKFINYLLKSMKYTKYADKYVHQTTNYAVHYFIDYTVQSMDDCRDLSQPTVAANALPRLWAVKLPTL
jgi:hypothetical protein